MCQSHWDALTKTVGAVWVAVGPLIGVLVGSYLATKNQRRQWVLDNKRSEYRELVSAMTQTITLAVNTPAGAPATQLQANVDSEARSLAIIHDRIFIAKEIRELKVLERWHSILEGIVNRTENQSNFDKLKEDLINSATKLFA